MRFILIVLLNIVFCSYNFAEMRHDHHKHKVSRHSMHHKMINAQKPYPKLNLKMEKDKMDGYNLNIKVSNFTFAPENVNGKNQDNQGHAHIYINGNKIRQYSPFFHLSGKLLKNGKNIIRVTLNANDHSVFAINMKKIEAIIHIKK